MATPKLLPVGIPTFRDIINGGYLYVDKTPLIYELIRNPKGIYFLARPRRFGKSMLVSTLLEIFTGNRELFRDLWLYDSPYGWEQHPVIHLDFNYYSARSVTELETSLKYFLQKTAAAYDITLTDTLYYIQFGELIRGLAEKYQKQVVVLIDEYDRPLIDCMTNLEEAKRVRNFLKGFYRVLKSSDAQLRFIFLTGISKFSKVGIFSDLNNLQDLSMDDRFAALPGITQTEVETAFHPYLASFAQKKGIAVVELIEEIRFWYNGFRFTKAPITLYNPYSLVCLLEAQDFRNYWFESGTPTFLVNLIKEQQYELADLKTREVGELAFSTYEIDNLAILPLLYQTGYLTIKNYNEQKRLFELYYPNREVEDAFLAYLLDSFSQLDLGVSEGYLWQLIEALQANDLTSFFEILTVFFARIPYTLQVKREKYYQTIFYLIFTLIGLRVQAEVTTNRGRIDAVIEVKDAIYLFEFKLNGSAESALAQIKSNAYYEQYQRAGKPLHLVGANFSTRKRGISEWKSEPA
ncbi:MAG: AAA family ATPase [Caldilineaceae bacterium]|jgi:hypothetical protein